jgi:hypothetical protein
MVSLPSNPVARLSGYELRHLVLHLEACGLIEELHRLLALETSTRSNAWFEAKQAYDDIQGYLDDVSRAWRIAEASYLPTDEPQEARSLGLQIRYALITSSVYNLISNIPPILLATLVEKGVWTPLRAFNYAKRTPYSTEALQRLAPFLDTQQLIEAIALVRNLPEDRQKWLQELFALAPEITTKLGREVLASMEDKASLEQLMGNALAKLAEQIPNEQITDALKVAQALSNNAFAALSILLSRLAAQGATQKAIRIAKEIGDSLWRAKTFKAILPYLSEHDKNFVVCSEVFTVLQNVYLPEKVETLALLIPHLPLEEPQEFRELRSANQEYFKAVPLLTRPAITTHALECAREIDNKLRKAEAFAHLVPVLLETDRLSILSETLSLVKEVEPESYRDQAMEVLAEQLREPLWSEALDVVKSVQDDFWRYMTLKPLIPHLPDTLLPEALAILYTLRESDRYEVLKSLATRLTKPMLQEVLQIVEDQYYKSRILRVLAPQLDETILRELLQATYPAPVQDEHDEEQDADWHNKKSTILEALAPRLSEAMVREALAIATPKLRFFQMEPRRFRTMRGILIPQLARLGFPEEAMSAIREHKVELDTKIIVEIAQYLPEAKLGELLAMIRNPSHKYERKQALNGLAPYLSPTLLQEAIRIASTIGDTDQLDQALGKTANSLALLGYTQAAIETVLRVKEATKRASILREMIERSSETGRPLLVAEALKATRQIESIENKTEAVAALMSHIPETERISLVDELLSEMEKQKQAELSQSDSRLSTMFWLDRQIKILTTLAEKLPEDKRQPLLAKALSLARGTEPVVSLPPSDPVEKFTKLDRDQQVQIYTILQIVEKHPLIWRLLRTFLIIWATEDTRNGIDGLFGLLTWLSGFECFSILLDTYQIAWEIQEKEQRAQMFVKLLPLYPQGFIPIGLDQVLAAIRLVDDEIKRASLLNEVMAYVSGDEYRKVCRELFRISPPKSWSPKDHEEPFIDMFVEMERNRKWTDSFPSIVRHLVRKIIKRAELKFPSFEPAFRPAKVSETFFEQVRGGGNDAKLRDRVQALTRIAPLLSETERKSVLYEALEIVHTLDKEDKGDALLKLFPLFPESERMQIFQEAISEIWKYENISMSFSSLIALIPHLTETEKSVAIPEILRVVLKGGGPFTRGGELMAEILPYLSEAQIYEALDVLRSCPAENWKLEETITIATRLVELGHLAEGLGLISEIPSQGFYNALCKGWGLTRIAFSLPESLVRQALELAQSLPAQEAGHKRTQAIAVLSFRLAKFGHAKEALAILREFIPGSMWYAIALSAMTDLVSEQERNELTMESLSVARSLTDSDERTKCLDATISQWFKLPAVTRYSLWKDWLHDLTARTRANLLADISSLMPVVAVYGLESALYEVGSAICDVGRWWP